MGTEGKLPSSKILSEISMHPTPLNAKCRTFSVIIFPRLIIKVEVRVYGKTISEKRTTDRECK